MDRTFLLRRLGGRAAAWQRVSAPSRRWAGSSPATALPRRWPGATVVGVAAAVGGGAVGWGVAMAMQDRQRSLSVQDVVEDVVDEEAERERFATVSEMNKAIQEIISEIGTGDDGQEDIISTDDQDLRAHGYSEWSTVNPDRLPVAVAYPRCTEHVVAVAKACHRHGVPLIAYSGGSSVEGNFSAPYGGISIDFAYMDRIVQFNKDDMDIVVQPGIGWQDLNRKLVDMGSGLFFPIDPGPTAKIGGMIGTNCSGTNAVKYGTMRDWVINLTVVLADGRVIKTRRRPRKSSAGYHLNGLFVGSEGTLGIVTQATLKLAVIPEACSVAVVAFPSIRDAAAAATGVMQAGIPVACMEIMDEVQMRVVNLSGRTLPRTWKESPTLFFKFTGARASVAENMTAVRAIASQHRGGEFETANDEDEQRRLWSARKEALWSMLALRKDAQQVWGTDVAVPLSRLADLIEISKKEMDELGLFASILGHVGNGNFHETILYDGQVPGEREKVEQCVRRMVGRALAMEGTCTGEHSIGWGKKDSLILEVGPETVGVMTVIKKALDPKWILNPGKIIDVPWLPETAVAESVVDEDGGGDRIKSKSI